MHVFQANHTDIVCMAEGLNYGWCQRSDVCNAIEHLSFAESLLECMTFIVANTIETVIGIMGEISNALDFQPLPSYFGFFHLLLNVVIFVMSKSVLQEWRCFRHFEENYRSWCT